jgi:hypothetical protein
LTIEALSDDILLHVFDTYRQKTQQDGGTWPWHVLAHICQRWRRFIFAYPVHLNLRLKCKSRTDAEAALDIWPTLPIVIKVSFGEDGDEGDIVGALDCRDRVAGIQLWGITTSRLKKCVALMRETFPILTYLSLHTDHDKECLITDPFLGRSAPRLQELCLNGIRFPTLPNFLSSASDLVNLNLDAHMPPEAMASCLSVMTRLRSLTIYFKWPASYRTAQGSPSSTLTVLPALTHISLEGPPGVLDDFVSRIDAPLLDSGSLEFDDEPTFGAPQLPHFIHRAERLKSLDLVDVYVHHEGALLDFQSSGSAYISLAFPFDMCHTPVKPIEQIGTQWSAFLSHVEQFEIGGYLYYIGFCWQEGNALWLKFLRPFIAVQTLRLAGDGLLPYLANTGVLGRRTGERAAGVLPALHTILLCGSSSKVEEYARLLEPFIVGREHSGHPVVVEYE